MNGKYSFWFCSLLVIMVLKGWAQESQDEEWDSYHPADSGYLYTWRSFFSLEKVNQEIDLENPDPYLLSVAVFFATNRVREEEGLPPFRFSPSLRDMASFHAGEMARRQFVAHENRYNRRMYSMVQRGYFFQAEVYSENVASYFLMAYRRGARYVVIRNEQDRQFFYDEGPEIRPHTYRSFAEALVWAWMHSEGHRSNILDPSISLLGCGVKIDPSYRVYDKKMPMAYCVQNFGRGKTPLSYRTFGR